MAFELENEGVRLSLQLGAQDDAGVEAEIRLETRMGVLKYGDVFPRFDLFLKDLSAFHQTLDGQVDLRGYYGFLLRISHLSCGQLSIEAVIDDPTFENVVVRAKLRSDQSFIPQWISAFRQDMKVSLGAS
ncbi:hypothetical protein [Maricaulis alexandrii]|uniref:hypothetical protein n=1 Tax=Maricaulis alexandrii TaxID=2570354 RepID=UPI0011092A2A|nr:hypothetical protein [Maricaulis alexandrii]